MSADVMGMNKVGETVHKVIDPVIGGVKKVGKFLGRNVKAPKLSNPLNRSRSQGSSKPVDTALQKPTQERKTQQGERSQTRLRLAVNFQGRMDSLLSKHEAVMERAQALGLLEKGALSSLQQKGAALSQALDAMQAKGAAGQADLTKAEKSLAQLESLVGALGKRVEARKTDLVREPLAQRMEGLEVSRGELMQRAAKTQGASNARIKQLNQRIESNLKTLEGLPLLEQATREAHIKGDLARLEKLVSAWEDPKAAPKKEGVMSTQGFSVLKETENGVNHSIYYTNGEEVFVGKPVSGNKTEETNFQNTKEAIVGAGISALDHERAAQVLVASNEDDTEIYAYSREVKNFEKLNGSKEDPRPLEEKRALKGIARALVNSILNADGDGGGDNMSTRGVRIDFGMLGKAAARSDKAFVLHFADIESLYGHKPEGESVKSELSITLNIQETREALEDAVDDRHMPLRDEDGTVKTRLDIARERMVENAAFLADKGKITDTHKQKLLLDMAGAFVGNSRLSDPRSEKPETVVGYAIESAVRKKGLTEENVKQLRERIDKEANKDPELHTFLDSILKFSKDFDQAKENKTLGAFLGNHYADMFENNTKHAQGLLEVIDQMPTSEGPEFDNGKWVYQLVDRAQKLA